MLPQLPTSETWAPLSPGSVIPKNSLRSCAKLEPPKKKDELILTDAKVVQQRVKHILQKTKASSMRHLDLTSTEPIRDTFTSSGPPRRGLPRRSMTLEPKSGDTDHVKFPELPPGQPQADTPAQRMSLLVKKGSRRDLMNVAAADETPAQRMSLLAKRGSRRDLMTAAAEERRMSRRDLMASTTIEERRLSRRNLMASAAPEERRMSRRNVMAVANEERRLSRRNLMAAAIEEKRTSRRDLMATEEKRVSRRDLLAAATTEDKRASLRDVTANEKRTSKKDLLSKAGLKETWKKTKGTFNRSMENIFPEDGRRGRKKDKQVSAEGAGSEPAKRRSLSRNRKNKHSGSKLKRCSSKTSQQDLATAGSKVKRASSHSKPDTEEETKVRRTSSLGDKLNTLSHLNLDSKKLKALKSSKLGAQLIKKLSSKKLLQRQSSKKAIKEKTNAEEEPIMSENSDELNSAKIVSKVLSMPEIDILAKLAQTEELNSAKLASKRRSLRKNRTFDNAASRAKKRSMRKAISFDQSTAEETASSRIESKRRSMHEVRSSKQESKSGNPKASSKSKERRRSSKRQSANRDSAKPTKKGPINKVLSKDSSVAADEAKPSRSRSASQLAALPNKRSRSKSRESRSRPKSRARSQSRTRRPHDHSESKRRARSLSRGPRRSSRANSKSISDGLVKGDDTRSTSNKQVDKAPVAPARQTELKVPILSLSSQSLLSKKLGGVTPAVPMDERSLTLSVVQPRPYGGFGASKDVSILTGFLGSSHGVSSNLLPNRDDATITSELTERSELTADSTMAVLKGWNNQVIAGNSLDVLPRMVTTMAE